MNLCLSRNITRHDKHNLVRARAGRGGWEGGGGGWGGGGGDAFCSNINFPAPKYCERGEEYEQYQLKVRHFFIVKKLFRPQHSQDN